MSGKLCIDGLPGAELIGRGLEDYEAGRDSVEALLVEIAWPRLDAAGVLRGLTEPAMMPDDAEMRLYELLQRRHGRAAYTEYQSLLRRLVSFESAAEHRHRAEFAGSGN